MSSDLEYLRRKLREQLKKAPSSLATASVQTIREYKRRHAEATKLLQSRNATEAELASAIKAVS